MSKDCTYISLSSLKSRGWTESIIKRYALQHDKEAVNPYYRSAAPIKLYELHKMMYRVNGDRIIWRTRQVNIHGEKS